MDKRGAPTKTRPSVDAAAYAAHIERGWRLLAKLHDNLREQSLATAFTLQEKASTSARPPRPGSMT